MGVVPRQSARFRLTSDTIRGFVVTASRQPVASLPSSREKRPAKPDKVVGQLKGRNVPPVFVLRGSNFMDHKSLSASVAAIAFAGTAYAADFSVNPPPPPVPVFTWTGIYAGGQVGYAWGNDKPTWVVELPFIDFTETFNDSPQGVIGGAHVGYNQQFDKWVIGVEGSVDGTSLSKTVVAPLAGFGGAYTVAVTSQSSLQGSIRARVGIGWEPILLYGTGGVAFAGIQNDFVDTVGTFTGIPGSTASFSNTRVGWTAGGGLEFALTNNWTLRAEYRFSQFGNHSYYPYPISATLLPGFTFNAQQHFTESQAQVGFSYKFDSWIPAPVVAKY